MGNEVIQESQREQTRKNYVAALELLKPYDESINQLLPEIKWLLLEKGNKASEDELKGKSPEFYDLLSKRLTGEYQLTFKELNGLINASEKSCIEKLKEKGADVKKCDEYIKKLKEAAKSADADHSAFFGEIAGFIELEQTKLAISSKQPLAELPLIGHHQFFPPKKSYKGEGIIFGPLHALGDSVYFDADRSLAFEGYGSKEYTILFADYYVKTYGAGKKEAYKEVQEEIAKIAAKEANGYIFFFDEGDRRKLADSAGAEKIRLRAVQEGKEDKIIVIELSKYPDLRPALLNLSRHFQDARADRVTVQEGDEKYLTVGNSLDAYNGWVKGDKEKAEEAFARWRGWRQTTSAGNAGGDYLYHSDNWYVRKISERFKSRLGGDNYLNYSRPEGTDLKKALRETSGTGGVSWELNEMNKSKGISPLVPGAVLGESASAGGTAPSPEGVSAQEKLQERMRGGAQTAAQTSQADLLNYMRGILAASNLLTVDEQRPGAVLNISIPSPNELTGAYVSIQVNGRNVSFPVTEEFKRLVQSYENSAYTQISIGNLQAKDFAMMVEIETNAYSHLAKTAIAEASKTDPKAANLPETAVVFEGGEERESDAEAYARIARMVLEGKEITASIGGKRYTFAPAVFESIVANAEDEKEGIFYDMSKRFDARWHRFDMYGRVQEQYVSLDESAGVKLVQNSYDEFIRSAISNEVFKFGEQTLLTLHADVDPYQANGSVILTWLENPKDESRFVLHSVFAAGHRNKTGLSSDFAEAGVMGRIAHVALARVDGQGFLTNNQFLVGVGTAGERSKELKLHKGAEHDIGENVYELIVTRSPKRIKGEAEQSIVRRLELSSKPAVERQEASFDFLLGDGKNYGLTISPEASKEARVMGRFSASMDELRQLPIFSLAETLSALNQTGFVKTENERQKIAVNYSERKGWQAGLDAEHRRETLRETALPQSPDLPGYETKQTTDAKSAIAYLGTPYLVLGKGWNFKERISAGYIEREFQNVNGQGQESKSQDSYGVADSRSSFFKGRDLRHELYFQYQQRDNVGYFQEIGTYNKVYPWQKVSFEAITRSTRQGAGSDERLYRSNIDLFLGSPAIKASFGQGRYNLVGLPFETRFGITGSFDNFAITFQEIIRKDEISGEKFPEWRTTFRITGKEQSWEP